MSVIVPVPLGSVFEVLPLVTVPSKVKFSTGSSVVSSVVGTVTVVLTGRADGVVYSQPDVITFGLAGNELKAIAWDTNVYGSEGMTLNRQ